VVDGACPWYARLERGERADWFDFELGVEVDGQTMNLLPALLEQISGPTTTSQGEPPEWLAQHLGRAPVEVGAVLGSATLYVGELLKLKKGDVLRLDRAQSEPLPVLVEGIPKYRGRPVQRNGSFGVEIESEFK